MPEFDMAAARENLRKRSEKRREELVLRLAQARKDFAEIVAMIVKKYHPRRIYQWGSLLDQRRFSDISDIDVAVEGIATAEEFSALFGDASELTDFPLDLVQLEKIDKLHAESIVRKGKLVYERT